MFLLVKLSSYFLDKVKRMVGSTCCCRPSFLSTYFFTSEVALRRANAVWKCIFGDRDAVFFRCRSLISSVQPVAITSVFLCKIFFWNSILVTYEPIEPFFQGAQNDRRRLCVASDGDIKRMFSRRLVLYRSRRENWLYCWC